MQHHILLLPFALLAALASLRAQDQPATRPTQPNAAATGAPSLAQLIEELKQKEKKAVSVLLEMRSKGFFPGANEVRTSGVVRVSGATHVHVKMSAEFAHRRTDESGKPSEEVETGETETVKTPGGVWTREVDPMQGTVYTHIKPELAKRLEEAMKLVGEGGEFPGLPNEINAAHGSAMLESLAQGFDLAVDAQKLTQNAQEFWVVKGKAKAEPVPRGDEEIPEPDAVELLVRCSDHVIACMRQFQGGKPILEVVITKLETFDHELDPDSFKITLPEGGRFKDVMEHPPMKAQIEKLLHEAEAKKGTKK